MQELSKLIGPRGLTLETHNIQDLEALADLVSAPPKPRGKPDNPPPLLTAICKLDPLAQETVQAPCDSSRHNRKLPLADCKEVNGRLHHQDRLRLIRTCHGTPITGHPGRQVARAPDALVLLACNAQGRRALCR